MKIELSFFTDFFRVLFSSRRFFEQRFFELTSQRIFALSYVGVFLGVLGGSLLTMYFSHFVLDDFAREQDRYVAALETLGLSATNFPDMIRAQYTFSAVIACISPIIAYIAPHIFGGALFFFMWVLYKPNNDFDFNKVMECATASLTSMFFYAIPGIGPAIAIIALGVNASRALTIHFKLTGFFKVMSVISALYTCYFLSNGSLQLLSEQFASVFN